MEESVPIMLLLQSALLLQRDFVGFFDHLALLLEVLVRNQTHSAGAEQVISLLRVRLESVLLQTAQVQGNFVKL